MHSIVNYLKVDESIDVCILQRIQKVLSFYHCFFILLFHCFSSQRLVNMMKPPQTMELSVDENEKKELFELNSALELTQQQNAIIDKKIVVFKQREYRVRGNLAKIKENHSEDNLWMTVGKMFLKMERSEIIRDLNAEIEDYCKKISDLETSQQRVIQRLKRQRSTFDEFVRAHQVVKPSEITSDATEMSSTAATDDSKNTPIENVENETVVEEEVH